MSTSLTHSLTLLTLLVTAFVTMASEDLCDISGLDKIVVVRALWKASIIAPAAIYFNPYVILQTDLPDEDIRTALAAGYIDYLRGRLMKVDVRANSFSTLQYNRDNGYGAAERVITALRNS